MSQQVLKPGTARCTKHRYPVTYLIKYGCQQCLASQPKAQQQIPVEQPKPLGQPMVTVADIGMYEMPDGTIYRVKPNRDKVNRRVYAEKLVESPSARITETDTVVDFDFEYERGAVYKIKPEYKMPLARAKELMVRYSRCMVCGRTLKVAKSVEEGIGPVCIKYFRS